MAIEKRFGVSLVAADIQTRLAIVKDNWKYFLSGGRELPAYRFQPLLWWRLQMETFSALLAICAENSPVPGEFPTQRPVTRSFDVFFDLGMNKRLSKQWWGWWFETTKGPLWRHCNVWCGGIIMTNPCGDELKERQMLEVNLHTKYILLASTICIYK